MGRHPARVREPARAGVHGLAGVPDTRADRLRRIGVARLLDGLRPSAAQLDHPARRLGHARPRARRRSWRITAGPCCATAACRGCCSRTAGAPASRRTTGSATARTAVLSTIHVKQLVGMAPAEAWDEEFVYGIETYDVGMSGLRRLLRHDGAAAVRDGGRPARRVSAGPVGWPEDVVGSGAVRDGVRTTTGCRGCSSPRRRSSTRPGPAGPAHGQAAGTAGLGAAGGRGELGASQGTRSPTAARARAAARARPG